MVKMVGSFEVKDWDHWKKSFDAHKEPREAAGIKTVYVGNEIDNPNKAVNELGISSPKDIYLSLIDQAKIQGVSLQNQFIRYLN